MTKQERTELLLKVAWDVIHRDPGIDRIVLASLLIEAADRFLPVLEDKEEEVKTHVRTD